MPGLFEEIHINEAKGLSGWQERLLISNRAHLGMSTTLLSEWDRGNICFVCFDVPACRTTLFDFGMLEGTPWFSIPVWLI